MRLLVTGASGAIGTAVLEHLSSDPDVALVGTGRTPRDLSNLNAAHEAGSLSLEFLAGLMQTHGITHVIHAAGARTRDCERSPALAYEANVQGTVAVMQAARQTATVERVVFLSTAAVYGAASGVLDEDHPLAPASNYAISKATAEQAIHHYFAGAAFQATILRLGFVLGPRMDPAAPLSTLNRVIVEALNQGEATLRLPKRFHLHFTADLARALTAVLSTDLPEGVPVFHPPGFSLTHDEFSAEVTDALKQHGVPAHIRLDPDLNLHLPQGLSSARLDGMIPGLPRTRIPNMIQTVVDREFQLRSNPAAIASS